MEGLPDDPKHMDAAIAARKTSCSPIKLIYNRFWARLSASAQRDIDWMNGVRTQAPVTQEEVTEKLSISIDEMGDMYRGGKTLQKIADHFQLHPSTVHKNLLNAGVMMRKRGYRN